MFMIFFNRMTNYWELHVRIGIIPTAGKRGDNCYKILSKFNSLSLSLSLSLSVKIHWRNSKIFSRTTGWISTKFSTKHPWVIGIQVCSNKGPRPFTRGDTCNYKIVKLHWQNFKIFFFRTTGPISTKSGAKHLWVKGIHVCLNEGPHFFPTGDYYEISKKY